MKSGSLIVTRHSPMRGRLVQIFLIVLAVIVGTGLYYFGQYRAGYNLIDAREVRLELESALNELQTDKAVLRDRVALIEQSEQVDQQAYQQVKENLLALQQENLELREEVNFYRGIVAPNESSEGLRVDRFNIEKTDNNDLYHYKFVLTQVLKNGRAIRGAIKININGLENGLPKVLSLAEVSVKKQSKLEFEFIYFQRFEGDFKLPKGFVARQIQLEVSPFKRKEIKVNIDWPGVIAKQSTEQKTDAGTVQ